MRNDATMRGGCVTALGFGSITARRSSVIKVLSDLSYVLLVDLSASKCCMHTYLGRYDVLVTCVVS